LLEVQTGRAGRHRHQAVIGHARCGVDFQEPELPVGVLHHVRPAPTGDTQRLTGLGREVHEFLFLGASSPHGMRYWVSLAMYLAS
jgi:hypothetical protein